MCRYLMEKLEQTRSQKPKGTENRMAGKQTTTTFNNSQRTKETLGLYIYTAGQQAEQDKIQTDYKHHGRQEVTKVQDKAQKTQQKQERAENCKNKTAISFKKVSSV